MRLIRRERFVWVQPGPNLNGASVAVDNRASCSLFKRTEWCGGWVLGVGGVLIQHHDPANRVRRSAAAQVLPSLVRSNRRVDQPGTGGGGQHDCGAFGPVAFPPPIASA